MYNYFLMNTEEKLKKILTELVAIPSVSGDVEACQKIIAHIRDQLAPYNLFIRGDFEGNHPWFIATTQDTNTPDILLAAHLDVVPAKSYQLEERDSKLYGRGVYDMKIAAACYLEFFESHVEQLSDLNIGLLFTTDEELGGHSMNDVLATGLRPKMVFIPDGGDNWHIEERAKGFYHTRLTAHGKTSHGSRPWEGDNAVHRLLDALEFLRQSFPGGNRSDSTLSVTSLRGGEAVNQTPDFASATIDFRSFSKEDIAKHKAEITEIAAKNNLDVTVVQSGDPLVLDKNSPAIQNFLSTLCEFIGRDIAYTESYGGTDGRYFAPYNIPCLIIEPQGGGRHADEEWLLADDFYRYYRLIESWLLKTPA
jgi:acetylornithine deacetylase/succinyl-diaminopimelate desuccinylase-like protein